MLTRRLGGAGIARGGPARRPLVLAAAAALLVLLILPASVLACDGTRVLTQPSASSVPIGTAVSDSATVEIAGTAHHGWPQGSVTFKLYPPSNATCSGAPVWSETQTLSQVSGQNKGSASSSARVLDQAGIWRWKVDYASGNTDYWASSTSGCGEPVEVLKASPTINTTPSAGGLIGVVLNDSATLAGGSNPTGTITFRLYPPSSPSCDGGAVYTESVTVSGNGGYNTSPGWTTAVAGTYRWTAAYGGDSNNDPASSGCQEEQVVVSDKASPTINTTPSAGGFIGVVLNDSATLAGGNNPTGTITFRLYPPSSPSCDGGAVYTESVTVSGNGGYNTSPGWTTAAVGTYRWTAAYSGDSNNNPASSGCQEEQVVVTKAEPSIDTLLSVGSGPGSKALSVAIGTTVTDTATISNAYNPTGSVGFYIYAGNACQGDSTYVTGAISGASASAQHAFNAVGTYSWRAYWGGDANNEPAWSACDEFVYVNLAVPTIRTVPSASQVELGASITDTAYVQGGDSPTGSVTFYLYPPSDPTCQASPVFQQSVNLANGVATTNPVALTSLGTYRWSALYSGDAKNAAVAHICGEPVTVGTGSAPTPTPTPTPTPEFTPAPTPTPTPTPEFTPTPSGSVGPTAAPSASTMPETSVGGSGGTSDGGVLPMILVMLALTAGGLLVLSPVPRRIR